MSTEHQTMAQHCVVSSDEIHAAAAGNFSEPPMELVFRFSQFRDSEGRGLFHELESDRRLLAFLNAIAIAGRRKAMAMSNIPEEGQLLEEDAWEPDDFDEQLFAKANSLWDRMTRRRREAVLGVMQSFAREVLDRQHTEWQQQQQQQQNQKAPGIELDQAQPATPEPSLPESKTPFTGVETPSPSSAPVASPGSEARVPSAAPLSPPAAPSERRRSSLGLFTEKFDWSKLPPALKQVYDKQGHRREVIDGSTFWQFLTQCTVAKENPPSPVDAQVGRLPEEREEDEENEEVDPERLMQLLALMIHGASSANGQQPDFDRVEDLDVVDEEKQTSQHAEEKEQEDEEEKDDDHSSSLAADDELQAVLGALGQEGSATEEQMDQLRMLLAMLGGMVESAEIPAPQHKAKLQGLVHERRRDPDRQHLADLWEDLLQPHSDEEKKPQKVRGPSRFFGLRSKYASWRERRHAKKSAQENSQAAPPIDIVLDSKATDDT